MHAIECERLTAHLTVASVPHQLTRLCASTHAPQSLLGGHWPDGQQVVWSRRVNLLPSTTMVSTWLVCCLIYLLIWTSLDLAWVVTLAWVGSGPGWLLPITLHVTPARCDLKYVQHMSGQAACCAASCLARAPYPTTVHNQSQTSKHVIGTASMLNTVLLF